MKHSKYHIKLYKQIIMLEYNIKLLNNDILLYKKNIRTLEIENDKLRSEIVVKGQNYGKPCIYVSIYY